MVTGYPGEVVTTTPAQAGAASGSASPHALSPVGALCRDRDPGVETMVECRCTPKLRGTLRCAFDTSIAAINRLSRVSRASVSAKRYGPSRPVATRRFHHKLLPHYGELIRIRLPDCARTHTSVSCNSTNHLVIVARNFPPNIVAFSADRLSHLNETHDRLACHVTVFEAAWSWIQNPGSVVTEHLNLTRFDHHARSTRNRPGRRLGVSSPSRT